jgi:hypothetical protein
VIREELEHQHERQVLLDPRAITMFGLVVHRDDAHERAVPIFVYPEHQCGDLDELASLATLTQAQLDELVHNRKGEEAAAINNGGMVEQLGYLTGVHPDVIERFLRTHARGDAGG